MRIARRLKSLANNPERGQKLVSEEKLAIFKGMDLDDYYCKEVEKVANSMGIKSEQERLNALPNKVKIQ